MSSTLAPDWAYLEHVAHIMRQLDDVCEAAAKLRAHILRQMQATSDLEKPAADDPAVTTARKTARVRKKSS